MRWIMHGGIFVFNGAVQFSPEMTPFLQNEANAWSDLNQIWCEGVAREDAWHIRRVFQICFNYAN